MAQNKLPLINSAHGSDTRNIINELIRLFNNMGYTYDEALQKAHNVLNEAQQTNDMNVDVQQQIDTLIAESGTSDAEVLQARIDAEGNEYPVLKDRLDENDTQLAQKAHETSGGDNEALWYPPMQPTREETLTTRNYEDFIDNTYESLRNEFPEYISREIVGLDESGTYNFYKYVFEPKHYEKTIIIGAGIHGAETHGIIHLYRFMYHVCHDHEKYPQLTYARKKIRYIIMPIQSPHGFVNTSNDNVNGVNINRNFDHRWDSYSGTDGGSEPLSELETQHIVSVIEQYADECVGFIDIHNTGSNRASTMDYYCALPRWGYNNNHAIRGIMENISPIPNFKPFLDFIDEPASINHAAFIKELNAISLETVPTALGAENSSIEDMTNGFTFISNVILHMISLSSLKTISLKEEKVYNLVSTDNSFSTTSSSWVDIPNLTFTFTPKSAGIILLTGFSVLLSTDPTNSGYIVATITQPSNPVIPETTESNQRSLYHSYGKGDRQTLPLTRSVQILPKDHTKFGDVTIKIQIKTDGGTLQHLRSNVNITFIPTNSWNVENWEVDSQGVLVRKNPPA